MAAATPTPKPKPKAPARTKGEIAQDRLDTAQAVVDRITDRIKTAEDVLAKAKADLAPAEKRRDFLAGDPDLPRGEDATVEAPVATSGSGASAPGDDQPKGLISGADLAEKPEHTDPIISGH